MEQWPLHNATFWETAPFSRILLPLVAGILCYTGLQAVGMPIVWVLVAGIISFALFFITAIRSGKGNPITFILFNISVACSIWSLCYFSDVKHDTNPIGTDTTGYTLVRIPTTPVVKEKTTRATVQALSVIKDGHALPASGQAYIYLYNSGDLRLQQGDTLLIPNHWQRITNRGNPFELDYATYCARNNLYYTQMLDADDVVVYGQNANKAAIITQMHNWCMQQLDTNIADADTRSLMQAMLLGDDGNLDDTMRQAWAETGIMHYIAISGGNITVFFLIIAGLLWWLRHRKHLWIKYVAALPLVWLYVFIAGAPPSAVRAAIMFSLLAGSLVLQKNNNALNTLLAAAAILLVAQPMWLYSAGFQLSFVAILSLILFYAPVYNLWSPSHIVARKVWQTIAGSLAVEILVAPLIIGYFHLFPLPFLISNVLAFLFMNVVLILGMAIIAFGFLPVVAKAIGWCTVMLTSFFNSIIYGLQDVNPRSFNYLYLGIWQLILVYLVIIGLALFVLRQRKPGLFLSVVAMCALLLLLCIDEYTALHQQRFVAYNMGAVNEIELMTGKQYSVLNTDIHTLTLQKDRTLKAPHAAWRAWQKAPADTNKVFTIDGHSLLIINKPYTTGSFPVDYVIVNMMPGKVDIASLNNVFHPHLLIFGSNYSGSQLTEWQHECHKLHIPVWCTGIKGAFVLSRS